MLQQDIQLHPAYVIHTWRFRESSLIVNFFTRDHGKVSAVARGARNRRNKASNVMQAFMPLEIAWLGRRELKTLTTVEAPQGSCILSGNTLVCGLYLNELLYRLLKPEDPYPKLFSIYAETLMALQQGNNVAPLLRQFEHQLLAELGYALCLTVDYRNGDPIDAEQHYLFDPLHGVTHSPETQVATNRLFLGDILFKINQMRYDDSTVLSEAKRLLRLALAPLLGTQPVKAREMLIALSA